ncbi:acetyl-coenzyme A carboxylase carboxyl transferase subunit alpha, chloroplastic-like [Aristolochia californica]|uniref:acetyl-coenzyme A carboxylase carboxyl transferase subunit alpha, chloroplastic-like n=1 Tax=Aristolochia californica TaxID=171875 RepID=UPI0035D898BA
MGVEVVFVTLGRFCSEMSSISLSTGVGREPGGFVSGSHVSFNNSILAANHLGSSFKGGLNGIWWKHDSQSRGRNGCGVCIVAKIRKGKKHEYPWPDDIDPSLKSGHLNYLSHFKPLDEKPKPVTLPFEKPLVDLEKKIIDVRKMADETGLDFTDQINSLEKKYQQALKDLYTHLNPIQRLSIARHPNRPTFLDHVLNITDKWVELHGDRAGYDDPAIVTGLGSINGKSYLFVGHQKGRNTKENIQRNFGMPTPHGYRKALRMMKYADHHGFPIITFIDTPGAFADLKSEELGQGEAIAYNLRAMFGLNVPIVTVVIGEGGSGGALAIGCANKLFMLENSVFYVASPEACAAILWKSAQAAPKAAEKLKITAKELCKLKIADGIIPEPLGGAHTDPSWTSQQIKLAVMKAMDELTEMDTEKLLRHRNLKFRILGGFQEGIPAEPERKRNMKPSEVVSGVSVAAGIEEDIKNLRKKILGGRVLPSKLLFSNEAIEKLKREVDQEMTNAFISMGLKEKLESIKMELSKSSSKPDQPLSPALREKVDKLVQDIKLGLSQPGSYLKLKQKLQTLTHVKKLVAQQAKGEKLKKEVNQKLENDVKEKMEVLKKAREAVAKGESLDKELIADIENAKAELKEILKSANLEVVETRKKAVRTAPPELAEKIAKADDEIGKEIEKAINVSGVRTKIEELKGEIAGGSSREKVAKLDKEIKEGIVALMDLTALKQKIEDITTGASS